jgi:PAS domain S-box-containing protein
MSLSPDDPALRRLFDDYIRMYASRDDSLTGHFSANFSGFTGGGDFLVKDQAQWVAITRQDFAQVKNPLQIELKDVAIQPLSDTIAVTTGFFVIHLPFKDHILSRETARLVLIFRRETAGWRICHSSISIPYHLVREGEVYPLKELTERNLALEQLVAERTQQLSTANENLRRANAELAREIAERKQTQDALHQSEERYRSILHASPDDITITDMAFRILMVSPAAVAMFGFDCAEQGIGRPLMDFVAPEDHVRAAFNIAQKQRGITTGPTEYRGLRRDGSTIDIETNSEFIRDASGAPVGMVFIIRDISDRKRLEAQNRQLQKAESLGRMAGAIAHHFNNQLQAVMMSLELAGDALGAGLNPAEHLNAAMESSRKAAGMSQLMLKYLGQTATNPRSVDLSDVCRESLTLLRAVIPPGIELASALPAPGPRVHADAQEIQHVITNLVTNAWEADAAAGGAISMCVMTVPKEEVAPQHRFPIDFRPDRASYACIEVRDAGCGIAATEIEHIFEPFYSTKFTGRGLGLPVALGIVRAHHGAITVDSAPGGGSTFRVFLPLPEAVAGP